MTRLTRFSGKQCNRNTQGWFEVQRRQPGVVVESARSLCAQSDVKLHKICTWSVVVPLFAHLYCTTHIHNLFGRSCSDRQRTGGGRWSSLPQLSGSFSIYIFISIYSKNQLKNFVVVDDCLDLLFWSFICKFWVECVLGVSHMMWSQYSIRVCVFFVWLDDISLVYRMYRCVHISFDVCVFIRNDKYNTMALGHIPCIMYSSLTVCD